MNILSNDKIDDFFSKNNYDIRKIGSARWIDQKCTPDVISAVADCIYNYYEKNGINYFSSKDIQLFDYTVENVSNIFKKPKTTSNKAKNEYDKFFSQPLEMFSYSGILKKIKKGNRNYYSVDNVDIIFYISISEKKALYFLNKYIIEVLKQSDLMDSFNFFFKNPNNENLSSLKEEFKIFLNTYTPIKKSLEPNRIFPKVLNPLAYYNNSYGIIKGYLSKDVITYDILMYNRDNFRDIYLNKPKGMTRSEYLELKKYSANSDYYTSYMVNKSKNFVRKLNINFNNGKSEVIEECCNGEKATHIHHIFPQKDFDSISGYIENLIALTPTQHLNKAHPDGNTRLIDKDYQKILLLAKSKTIEDDILINQRNNYSFNNFKFVLSVGFKNELFLDIDYLDFETTNHQILQEYLKN